MRSTWSASLSAGLYGAIGLSFILVLPWMSHFTNRQLDSTTISVALVLSMICAYFSYAALKVRAGTAGQKKRFAIAAAFFCGTMGAIAGWFMGIILGVPLFIALLGMKEPWSSR
jgi:hypothetical protein